MYMYDRLIIPRKY